MPFLHRLSRTFRTLRMRLTIWNTGVVLLAVIVALLSVREGLRYYLLAETDAVLNDEAKELILSIERWYPNNNQIIEVMARKAAGHADRDWHIRWLGADGKTTIWASPTAPQQPLSALWSERRDYRIFMSDTHRSVERYLKKPNLPEFYVRIGTPTQFATDDVNRLTNVLLPVGFLILVLAPFGGYLVSERAIEPLQQIIATTERLRPSQLEERLVVRGVGDELDQLAGKINQFLDQIADHLRRNRDFVANAAHELRSPLTAILSSVEVTLDQKRSAAEYEELLYSISEECHELSQLINQLLQLAEADAEMPRDHTMVSLADLVRRSVEMFEPVAEDRGIQIVKNLEPDVTVFGNRGELRQVVTNLLDNAIKFTSQNGKITLSIDADLVTGYGHLRVSDTGIGIPEDDLPRVFERFYRVDKARNRSGSGPRGNGLGLSICQAIVQSHRGDLAVSSRTGQGTTFTMSIPLNPA